MKAATLAPISRTLFAELDRIKGLEKIIRSPEYRKALSLPDELCEEYSLLAQGEYNVNYRFTHPGDGRRLPLRVNCGSQMHLEDQIGYEYRALEMLHSSGRTPEVFYVDGTMKYLDHGVLVMEELPGLPLDYSRDMKRAAAILADIHSTAVPEHMIPAPGDMSGRHALICPDDPLKAILDECEQMLTKYLQSDIADADTKARLRELLDMAWSYRDSHGMGSSPHRCCINTELNNTNFLISPDRADGSEDYLIDWEKPLYGDPAQDLGHFLAPTTTFWKTDVILDEAQMDEFVREYVRSVDGRFDTSGIEERTKLFTTVTCLRGVTWCAMAWVEYRQPGRTLVNESTMLKLDQYLDHSFLERIRNILGK